MVEGQGSATERHWLEWGNMLIQNNKNGRFNLRLRPRLHLVPSITLMSMAEGKFGSR